MPALRAAGDARVVTVTSLAHRLAGLDVDDLHFDRRRYGPGRAYAASKRANLLFADELDRRLRTAGDTVVSVAAHPGTTDTELLANSLRRRRGGAVLVPVARLVNRLVTQPVGVGVLPQLYAVTAPQVRGGDFVGPGGLAELRGPPAPARRAAPARDAALAARLWDVTAAATGVAPDPAA